MHEKINTERDDAGYLVQFAKQKSFAEFYRHLSSLKRILDFGFWISGLQFDNFNFKTRNRQFINL